MNIFVTYALVLRACLLQTGSRREAHLTSLRKAKYCRLKEKWTIVRTNVQKRLGQFWTIVRTTVPDNCSYNARSHTMTPEQGWKKTVLFVLFVLFVELNVLFVEQGRFICFICLISCFFGFCPYMLTKKFLGAFGAMFFSSPVTDEPKIFASAPVWLP